MNTTFLKRLSLACVAVLAMGAAHASVIITGTRVIYPADEKEVTVKLNNDGNVPALVQAWIDDGDSRIQAQTRAMPFTLLPPMFRLDPAKGQTLRMMYTQDPLPADRESVYYLNVLEIPPRPKADDDRNLLQMAFRSRIKIFFRPKGLAGDANDAPAKMTWSVVPGEEGKGYALQADNPTPYHVNVTRAGVEVGGKLYESAPGMVAPFSKRAFALEGLSIQPPAPLRMQYETVNDYGAMVPAVFPPENK
ncbi:fimbria/pilus periplasmic chaperone [Herbaspirillum sp.]|uniref:fimbrial biogenesis chaperone n=1 Tax=Herbaspirillum sp. TaxID=1890675 RepID=UPI0031D3CA3A